jgi:hypothetical protein
MISELVSGSIPSRRWGWWPGRLRVLIVVEAVRPGRAGELAGVGEDGGGRARRS